MTQLLTDKQIRRLARKGMIKPFHEEEYGFAPLSAGVTSLGYDARLGYEFKQFTIMGVQTIDPTNVSHEDFHEETLYNDLYCLDPGSFVLAHTIEYFRMPENVGAVCHGKSTYARCGIHVNVTPLEPGWEGQVTLEIFNQSPRTVLLHPGRGICQFQFFAVNERPEITYRDKGGKYQGQTGVTHGR